MKVKTIKPNVTLPLDGVKFSGSFIANFQTLGLYLLAPEELVKLKEQSEDEYLSVIEPFFVLINEVNLLMEKNELVLEEELPDNSSSE